MAAAAFFRAASFACFDTAGAAFFFSALAAFLSALAFLLRPARTSRGARRGAGEAGAWRTTGAKAAEGEARRVRQRREAAKRAAVRRLR